jgi:hypothetical protein
LIKLGSEPVPVAARKGWRSGISLGRMSMVSGLVSDGCMRPIPPAAAYESRTNRPGPYLDVAAYAPDAAYAISAL